MKLESETTTIVLGFIVDCHFVYVPELNVLCLVNEKTEETVNSWIVKDINQAVDTVYQEKKAIKTHLQHISKHLIARQNILTKAEDFLKDYCKDNLMSFYIASISKLINPGVLLYKLLCIEESVNETSIYLEHCEAGFYGKDEINSTDFIQRAKSKISVVNSAYKITARRKNLQTDKVCLDIVKLS